MLDALFVMTVELLGILVFFGLSFSHLFALIYISQGGGLTVFILCDS